MSRGVSPGPYAHLTDVELDAQIELLEWFLALEEEDVAVAHAERARRGAGAFELTEAAQIYLSCRTPAEAEASAQFACRLARAA